MNLRVILVFVFVLVSAADALAQRYQAVPVQRLPLTNRTTEPSLNPAANIDRLKQPRPKTYILGAGDVLGVFAEGVLGEIGSSPPVHIPPAGSDVPPSMGFPVLVRGDGTISLPLLKPISVQGLSLIQAEELVKAAYLGNNQNGKAILLESSRIIVSLQRKRTINVTVIRQDNSRSFYGQSGQANRMAVNDRSDFSARSRNLQLSAYDNDLLNALIETGGLPGVNAKSIRVLRSQDRYQNASGQFEDRNSPFPRTGAPQKVYRPSYQSGGYQSAVLGEGDVVLVEARPTEVFYTGGLLGGGEYLIPRDKSLNILEAISVAGGSVGAQASSTGYNVASVPPTELIVVRNSPTQGQLNIRVDINQAIANPSHRIAVQPGDTLILRHSPSERAKNIGIQTLNAYGIYRLLN